MKKGGLLRFLAPDYRPFVIGKHFTLASAPGKENFFPFLPESLDRSRNFGDMVGQAESEKPEQIAEADFEVAGSKSGSIEVYNLKSAI